MAENNEPYILHAAILHDFVKAAKDANPIQVDAVLRALMSPLHAIASRYARQPSDIPVLQQVACQALVRAAEKYDPSRCDSFERLANKAVKNAILDQLKAQRRWEQAAEYFAD